MKMLTLTQPYATGIAIGLKHWETRSWPTHYRGPLGIHAAKGFPQWAKEFASTERALGRLKVQNLPLGAVVAIVDLVDVLPTGEALFDTTAVERLWGDFSYGRYAWQLENVRPLPEPIPWQGKLGLWTPPPGLLQLLEGF